MADATDEQGELIADAESMRRAITRISHEIVERHGGIDNLALVGIHRGGFYIAKRIHRAIADIEGEVKQGAVDISLYRDDGRVGFPKPQIGVTDLPFELEGSNVVLVDDVLFTGRTVRAALDAMNDYGRAKRVELAVLVDRGHRELPIGPDYVGFDLPTKETQRVDVLLEELGTPDSIWLRMMGDEN